MLQSVVLHKQLGVGEIKIAHHRTQCGDLAVENTPEDIVYSVHIVATAAWLSNEEGASDARKCARAHEISEQMGRCLTDFRYQMPCQGPTILTQICKRILGGISLVPFQVIPEHQVHFLEHQAHIPEHQAHFLEHQAHIPEHQEHFPAYQEHFQEHQAHIPEHQAHAQEE
ncbi:hypothetical protein E2320_021805 [Naja naja]|nr:hypothetical protein E2320_021805 [Naja naja]